MKLSEIKDFEYELISGNEDVEFEHICYDSRKINENDIFVCLTGSNFDAHSIIKDIALKKPSYIIVEKDIETDIEANIIKVDSTRQALAILSAAIFAYPATKMTMIGVTGTKGKTTTTHMLKAILEKSGNKVGMIGTNGIFIGDERIPSKNTTPESYELHKNFKDMLDAGCKYVVMEVSSQAVKMDRSYGISFDYGIFSNISPDHIGKDEHKDFAEYLDCKTRFLKQCKLALVNLDNEHASYILEHSDAGANFTFGSGKGADFYYSKLKYVNKEDFVGVDFFINGIKNLEVKVGIPGLFNVYNALSAIAIGVFLKIDDSILSESLANIKIDGRMEIVYSDKNFSVIVDYAHNAMSMESLLSTLKNYKAKRLVVVFGCGGNRAKDRRYSMGEIAAKMADFTIVTADNSRFEKVEDITEDILSRIRPANVDYICIYDRAEAIRYAIENVKRGDIIAIIGKGHEDYQEINGERYYFKDADEVIKAVEKAKEKGLIDA